MPTSALWGEGGGANWIDPVCAAVSGADREVSMPVCASAQLPVRARSRTSGTGALRR